MKQTGKTLPNELKIVLTGMIPCQKELLKERDIYGDDELTFEDCFKPMKPLLERADLAIGSISTDYDYQEMFLNTLKDTGFDVLTLGVRRTGAEKAKSLVTALDECGIGHPEGDRVAKMIIDVKGIKVGIIDCTFNLAFKDMDQLSEVLSLVQAV